MRFFSSDHHFFHTNILKYEADHRPFQGVDEMNRALIERWNARVSPSDEVFYLGDFAFGRGAKPAIVSELLASLNGHISLVQGNHDPRLERCLELGFKQVWREHTLPLAGREVRLCHFPYPDPAAQGEWVDKHASRRPQPDGRWLLHGHVHGLWRERPELKMINVSVERWGLAPVSSLELEAIINTHDPLPQSPTPQDKESL